MPHSLTTLVEKHLGANFVPRLRRTFADLAQDFWADGSENPILSLVPPDLAAKLKLNKLVATTVRAPAMPMARAPAAAPSAAGKPHLWHAAPGEISEKMWGEGMVTPGDAVITEKLYKPLGLTKETSVLDLSAGLGGRLRQIADETGAYITGLEPDPAIALRGMQMSQLAGQGKHAPVAPYDPATFSSQHSYDCIIARETFYRVADKQAFLKAIASCLKPKGQVTFTDYIVDPENRDNPVIKTWCASEKHAAPLGLVETAEAWAKIGINLRVNEDLSDFYKKEVAAGLKRFAAFLVSAPRPDIETREALRRRLETWTHRMAAMSQGMKFYRFHGTR